MPPETNLYVSSQRDSRRWASEHSCLSIVSHAAGFQIQQLFEVVQAVLLHWHFFVDTALRDGIACHMLLEDTQWTVNSLGLVASAHLFLSSASTSLLSFIAAPPNVRPNNQSFCCRASMKGQIGHQQRFIQQIRRITNISVRVSDRTQASHMPQERRYQIP